MVSQEATQPATQIVVDPRRLGQQDSDLDPGDLADICCILHPISEPARRACHLIKNLTPEHTVAKTNTTKTQVSENSLLNTTDNDSYYDIALRLSAQLKFPITGGFYFGRNLQRCDILIGKDASRRISNIHFRIYINEYGYLMLEDLSTNGTAVDGVLLRANVKGSGLEFQHVLVHGSLVTLTMNPEKGEEDYRFVIRIPTRDLDAEEIYQKNLSDYFRRMAQAKNEKTPKIANRKSQRDLLNLFPEQSPDLPTTIPKNLGRRNREWMGGPKYNKVSRIGKGAFATVYLVTSKYDGVPYAAKELEKRRFMKNGILDQKLDDEMKIMQKIKHPNIVQYVEHINWEAYLYIIMEYVQGGDLGNLISQSPLPEPDVKIIARQLLSALKYLHDGGITHRDVKPDNILVSSYSPLQVKLTDFGLSKMINNDETFLTTFCGTLLYCAPEVYLEYREFDENGKRTLRGAVKSTPHQRYGSAVDIWSLAGVLFYSLCSRPPYPVQNGENYLELLTRIMSQSLDIRPLQHANVSDDGISCIRQMLHIRPSHRATIRDLERSPWVSEEFGIENSMDLDVGNTDDNSTFPQLEESASQLSIQDQKIGPDDKPAQYVRSELTETKQMEVSCSFETNKDLSRLLDSYEFSSIPLTKANDSILIGEIQEEILESSGVIPPKQLNLPSSRYGDRSDITRDLKSTKTKELNLNKENEKNILKLPSLPQKLPSSSGILDLTTGSSSLFGAESMVEQLNMYSPLQIDTENSKLEIGESLFVTNISLRRPRDEDPNFVSTNPKRRRGSARKIKFPVPPKTQWKIEEPSNTYKNDFLDPTLGSNHLTQSQSLDKYQIFTGSLSISSEIESISQYGSGLKNEKIQHDHMNPEYRRVPKALTSDSSAQLVTVPCSRYTPKTETDGPEYPFSPIISEVNHENTRQHNAVLAKLVATNDSCLPTIKMNLKNLITSWGRGSKVTIRYHDVTESRIPKYAFKIMLFKQGYYDKVDDLSCRTTSWTDEYEDMGFYISTKASVGIWINDFNLPSHDRQNPNTESKYWGQLKHGDLITVWRHDSKPNQIFTRFRFECYLGQSKYVRQCDDQFKLIQDGPYLIDLEQTCRKLEKLASTDCNLFGITQKSSKDMHYEKSI